MSRWNTILYDVWGNDEDGYEVNDCFAGPPIELEGEQHFDNAIVLEKLMESGFQHYGATVDDLTFDSDEDIIYINDAKNGKPILCIQRDQRW
jgi:hypothetical protein